MRSLVQVNRFLVRKLKNIAAEEWVEKPADAYIPFQDRKIEGLEIKYYQDIKRAPVTEEIKEELIPCSPKMGPYTVMNPKIYNKTYRWCSCGQSLNQPFCDSSHEGTGFKPLKFTIEQSVKQVNLCGCKLTKNKPFCDGESCACKTGESK